MITRRAVSAAATSLLLAPAAGAQCAYAGALSRAWGGPLDADVAHRRARREARRLQQEMDRALRAAGLRQGTVGARLAALFADARWLYPDSDSGRDRAVADMNERLAMSRPRLAGAFGPRVMPQGRVLRMSAEDEARGRGGYRDPPDYVVDLKAIRQRPSWSLPSVAFHETTPGHALHAPAPAAGASDGAAPFSVYAEAWAVYAEQLADEMGVYADDPLGRLGYLHWRLFRMARVVADTGLGGQGWSAERAAAAMEDLQGPAIAFTTIRADVRRMAQQPGLYAAQGLGALEIVRLRPRSRVDWPAFHDRLLTGPPWACARLADVVTGDRHP